jgi:exonuclease III
LYRCCALRNLISIIQEYKIDILAIQEVRWIGQNISEKKEGTIYYSCHNQTHQFGTGFMVNKNMKHLVIDFQPIDMRLCKLILRGQFHNYSIFNAHASTEEKEASEKDTFYDMLEKEYKKCPKHDIKILLGDFNAKIGQEENLKPVTGMNSLHKVSNDNEMRLISYVASMDMVVRSTLFPHKNIYKASWKSPDGSTTNQIGHVLIDYHHKSNLQDMRSYRGANIDSNHFLIIAKL